MSVDLQSLVIFLLVGLAAGWLASLVIKSRRIGLLGYLAVGVVGALLGGFLFRAAGVAVGLGLVGDLIVAFIGSLVLLFLLRAVR